MAHRVAVVVLNWNGKHFLRACLDPLLRQSYRNFYVIFVDNASTDGSAGFVKEAYRRKIKNRQLVVVENSRNYGFAEGNNIGIRRALADRKTGYVAVLNNDTEAHKEWIEELVKAANRDKKIGSVASKILDFKKRNVVDTCGIMLYADCIGSGRGYGEYESNYGTAEEVFGAYGAAAFYKREMLEDTKLGEDFFDSEYFTFQEELDLSWRAQLRGWKCVLAPEAKIFHIGSGTFQHMAKKGKYLLERNSIFTIVKNLQPELLWYCLPRIILYQAISLPFYTINGQFFAVVKGRMHGVLNAGKFLQKRKYIQKRAAINALRMKRLMERRDYVRSFIRNI